MAFLPNVAFPGTAANEGVENLMKQLLQRRIAESQNAYQQGQLGVSRENLAIAKEKLPLEKALLQAQTGEHAATAQHKNLIANALKIYLQRKGTSLSRGGQAAQSQAQQFSNPNGINETDSNQYLTSNESENDPIKELLYATKAIQETPTEQKNREIATDFAKSIHSADQKTREGWNQALEANYEIKDALKANSAIYASPKVQEALSHPEYLGYNVAYLKNFGKDKELAQDLTTIGTNNKTLYTNILSKFKGAVREYELNLLKSFIANEDKDNINVMIAKNNALQAMTKNIMDRTSLADKIYIMGNGKITTAQAMEMADNRIDGKKIREDIKNNFKAEEKKQKIALYEQQAKDAIAKGADPEKVNKHLSAIIKGLK